MPGLLMGGAKAFELIANEFMFSTIDLNPYTFTGTLDPSASDLIVSCAGIDDTDGVSNATARDAQINSDASSTVVSQLWAYGKQGTSVSIAAKSGPLTNPVTTIPAWGSGDADCAAAAHLIISGVAGVVDAQGGDSVNNSASATVDTRSNGGVIAVSAFGEATAGDTTSWNTGVELYDMVLDGMCFSVAYVSGTSGSPLTITATPSITTTRHIIAAVSF